MANPEDAYTVSQRALELGFSSTIGIIHDGSGQLKPLGEVERSIWDRVRKLTRRSYSRFNHFQEAIANGKPNDWRCRAGARYLYICEFGLVHYCSQQRGFPGVPLAEYKKADVQREFLTEKGLRAKLHHQLRAPGQLYRSLAGTAGIQQSSARGQQARRAGVGANPLAQSWIHSQIIVSLSEVWRVSSAHPKPSGRKRRSFDCQSARKTVRFSARNDNSLFD